MIFPLGLEAEFAWPDGFRGFLYAAAMVYWFLAVAIVADLFMASIEMVTGRRKKTRRPTGQLVTVKVWNETVATLTLMALGSSAPEIFLSVIDIVKKEFHFGALGPSTIVGSAAFNLLVIIAVCVFVIPHGEVRIIKNIPAFYITALFSIVAYVWMALILSVVSPDVVDLWEAVVTFLLLPVLVVASYKTDLGDADWVLRRLRIIDPEVFEEQVENRHGFVSFSSEQLKVTGADSEMAVEVAVLRRKVSCAPGPISCAYRTEAVTAVPGYDFEEIEGALEFAEDEMEKTISFKILGKRRRIFDCEFLVLLQDLEGGPTFDPDDDGGEDEAILTVAIGRHGPEAGLAQRTLHRVCNPDTLRLAFSEWREQMWSTLFVNGSLEEQREAGVAEWVIHVISFPWKVTIGTMPPTCLFGGWACFYASLIGIAVLTTCVSDLAELFGCVLGIPDIVTAVTFVALGTSMPDLFASLTAAKEDPTADASIVNVTGSNSVNVFLGLGVPWTVAAVYWMVVGRTADWEARYPKVASRQTGSAFVVESANLGFSVGMFCYVSVLAIALLQARRRWLLCELGGPFVAKVLASLTLIFLWCSWVAVVSWRVLRSDSGVTEDIRVFSAMFVATMLATLAVLVVTRISAVHPEQDDLEERQEATVSDNTMTKAEDADVRFAADTGGTGSMDSPEANKAAVVGLAAPDDAKESVIVPAKKLDLGVWDDSFFTDDLGEEKPRAPMSAGVSGRPASSRAV